MKAFTLPANCRRKGSRPVPVAADTWTIKFRDVTADAVDYVPFAYEAQEVTAALALLFFLFNGPLIALERQLLGAM